MTTSENPAPFELSVPNSNPNSAFSHFELISVREYSDPNGTGPHIETVVTPEDLLQEHATGPVFYTIYGRYDPDKREDNFGGVVAIANISTLAAAKQLLVDLNGPLPENDD